MIEAILLYELSFRQGSRPCYTIVFPIQPMFSLSSQQMFNVSYDLFNRRVVRIGKSPLTLFIYNINVAGMIDKVGVSRLVGTFLFFWRNTKSRFNASKLGFGYIYP